LSVVEEEAEFHEAPLQCINHRIVYEFGFTGITAHHQRLLLIV